jgi:hypothetical protein
LVLRFFYPCELVGIVGFICLVVPYSPVLAVFVVPYILGEFAKMKLGWRLPLFYPEHPTVESYLPLLNNEFYEVWLPCALAVQLTFVSLSYCLLLLIHVVLFRRIIRERVVILGRLVCDLGNVFWRGANE